MFVVITVSMNRITTDMEESHFQKIINQIVEWGSVSAAEIVRNPTVPGEVWVVITCSNQVSVETEARKRSLKVVPFWHAEGIEVLRQAMRSPKRS